MAPARPGNVLASTDRCRLGEVRRLDDMLDRLNTAIKRYLTALDPADLSGSDHHCLSQAIVFATNLEAASDVVDRDVTDICQAPEACIICRAGAGPDAGL